MSSAAFLAVGCRTPRLAALLGARGDVSSAVAAGANGVSVTVVETKKEVSCHLVLKVKLKKSEHCCCLRMKRGCLNELKVPCSLILPTARLTDTSILVAQALLFNVGSSR